MNDAPDRIWATCGEYWRNPTFTEDKTEYIRADLSDALIREAMEAMEKTRDSMCEGFCGDLSSFDIYYPDMGLDCAVCSLRPRIAKLRAHLGEDK